MRAEVRAALGGLRLERPVATALAVLARPGLWLEVVRVAWVTGERHRPGSRIRRPLPTPAYLAFRAEAMLGAGDRGLRPGEVVAYLAWCRTLRRLRAR